MRRAVGLASFVIIGGIILIGWSWSISENPPVTVSGISGAAQSAAQNIQSFRESLGAIKQRMLDAFSGAGTPAQTR